MTMRTRFAPSPTGYLHIGGVRTALFNWLLARQHGGQFVLRIDDTDVKRNVGEALEPILDGFRWLGIDWDEGPGVEGPYGPYYQSQRTDLYQAAVDRLLESGAAYRDYATTEELATEREAAQTEGGKFIYSRTWMAETEADERRFESEGRKGVVRLRMPREGHCRFNDLVRGDIEVEWAREQDHVIQRADGSVLYNLANVVDDHEMAITHVVRAEEHLANTARQVFIAQSLGWEPPRHAHVPFVAEPGSKTKLSKRKLAKYLRQPEFAKLTEHGQRIADAIGHDAEGDTFNPVIVDFYETVGYLPDALLNYLLLLGWSLDDKTEHFSRDEMIEHFSLGRVQKSPASFDPTKLMSFEERHMQGLPVDEKVALSLPYVELAGWVESPASEMTIERIWKIVAAAGDRIKVAGDILDYPELFVTDDDLEYDEAAFEKRLRKPEAAAGLLREYRNALTALETWDLDNLEQGMRDFVAERDLKLGAIIHAARVAVTGRSVGFGMFETLEILGRERTLERIDRALERL